MLVDSREPKEITKKLASLISKVTSLEAGDYWIDGKEGLVIIERKSVGDLVSSVQSNLLTEQCRKIAKLAKVGILLIEGWLTCTVQGDIRADGRVIHISWNYLWNYLQSLQNSGFLIDWSPNLNFTPYRLISLHSYYTKPVHSSLRNFVRVPSALPKPIQILCSLEHIDIVLATRLLEHFGNVKNVLAQPWQKLTEVEGIGQVKAKNIVRQLEEML